MIAIVGALAPIFLLIVMGRAARARQLLPDSFWLPLERLTYYVLFPSLLVSSLAEARLAGLPALEMVAAQAVGVLGMAAVALALRPVLGRRPFRLDGAGFTSVFQGMVRPNTYVGLAAASGLWGVQGVTLTAICVALVVPLVNLLSVLVLVRHVGGKGGGWRAGVLPVVKNPLILACLLGVALNVTGIGLPPVAGPLLKILGQGALPLGLLAVGAGLELSGLRRGGPGVAVSALSKLALLPLLTGLAGWAMGVSGLPLLVGTLYAGLPCAPNAYMLARQMGGDARLVAQIITVQTLAAAGSLPLLVSLLP